MYNDFPFFVSANFRAAPMHREMFIFIPATANFSGVRRYRFIGPFYFLNRVGKLFALLGFALVKDSVSALFARARARHFWGKARWYSCETSFAQGLRLRCARDYGSGIDALQD